MAEARSVNWWVRTQVGVLTLLLVAMAGYRFLYTDPVGMLDSGLLLVIVLVIVLMLSEAFDSFSVGKILTFSREVQKKEKEVAKLEDQNAKLLSQLISISTQQSQAQTSTNVYGDYHAGPFVEKATPEEIEVRKEAEEATVEETVDVPAPPARPPISLQKAERLGLEKYVQMRGYSLDEVVKEAKLVSDFRDLDSISNSSMYFDAYVRAPGRETFVELKLSFLSGQSVRDRVYVMLSKIDHYRRKRNSDAHLDLVLISTPSRPLRATSEERLLNEFQPALARGLLQIIRIELNAEEELAAAPDG